MKSLPLKPTSNIAASLCADSIGAARRGQKRRMSSASLLGSGRFHCIVTVPVSCMAKSVWRTQKGSVASTTTLFEWPWT